jgi:hypothetical protein
MQPTMMRRILLKGCCKSGRGLFKGLFGYLPGWTEEKHELTQSAYVPAEMLEGHFSKRESKVTTEKWRTYSYERDEEGIRRAGWRQRE